MSVEREWTAQGDVHELGSFLRSGMLVLLKDGICEADAGDGKSGKKLSTGTVTGIAVGGCVAAGILAVVVSRVAWPDGSRIRAKHV